MKRLFALSLALVMALSLAACGGSKTPAAGSASTPSTTSTTSTGAASSAPTSAKPADSAPVLARDNQVSEDIKADDGTVVVSVQYKPLSVSYPGNTEVEKTIQKDLDKVVADFLKAAKNYEEEAKNLLQRIPPERRQSGRFQPLRLFPERQGRPTG